MGPLYGELEVATIAPGYLWAYGRIAHAVDHARQAGSTKADIATALLNLHARAAASLDIPDSDIRDIANQFAEFTIKLRNRDPEVLSEG